MIGAVSCDGEKPLRPLDEADELDDGDGGNETGTESNEMGKQPLQATVDVGTELPRPRLAAGPVQACIADVQGPRPVVASGAGAVPDA